MNNKVEKEKLSISIILLSFFPFVSLIEKDQHMSIHLFGILFLVIIVFSILADMHIKSLKFNVFDKTPGLIFSLMILILLSIFKMEEIKNLGDTIALILILLVFLLLSLMSLNKREINLLMTSGIALAIIMSIIITFIRIPTYDSDPTARFIVKNIWGQKIDPNFIASYLVSMAIVCLIKFSHNKKLSNVIYYLIITYSVFLTGSRAAFIAIIISSIVWFGIYFVKTPKTKDMIFLTILLFFVVTTSILLFLFVIKPSLGARFFGSYGDKGNVLRVQAWKSSLNLIIQKPIFGHGHIPISKQFAKQGYYSMDVHNTVLNILYQYGFSGLFCLGMIFASFVAYMIKNDNIIVFPLVIGLGFTSLIISSQRSMNFWYTIILIYLLSSRYTTSLMNTKKLQ